MTRIATSLCWAGVLIAIAIADSYGLLERDTATIMYCLLPVFAFMALNGSDQCRLRRGEA